MSDPARRLRLDLSYDGTDFAGWQLQRGQRTVQGRLEKTLAVLQGGEPVRVHGAGRTDSGVHARGQVAHVDLRTRHDDDYLRHALGCLLPRDLACSRVTSVSPGFHARNTDSRKTYSYRIHTAKQRDPLSARYALHCPSALDHDRMLAAIGRLPGRRDWSGFAATSCTVRDRRRELFEATIERPSDHELVVSLTADGFLHHMVRNIVGTLIEIGRGRMDPGVIDAALDSGDRRMAGPTAPPHGLCLERILYRSKGTST